jgi:hypothetical protein
MNDIEKRKTALPTNEQKNLFEQYGDAATARSIEGTLMKFNKGDFQAGPSNDAIEIAIGTRFAAVMDSLSVGWLKWWDGAPVDPHMGLVVKGYQPERRTVLGDLDKSLWETDDDGDPKDPWQFTNYLILRRCDDGEIFTFTTSSKGGLGAIGELCKNYGKQMRQRPDEWPIIEIGVDSYLHRDRKRGRIKYPVFTIVGWVAKDDGGDGAPVTPEKPNPPAPKTAKSTAAKATGNKPAPKAGAAQTQF